MATYNLSELFEQVVDAVPDRTVVVTTDRRLIYRELEARANQLAHHLAAQGIGRGDHVALHLHNGSEYLEGMLACFKLSAVPININYRYVERELAYLYDHMDIVAAIIHRGFAPALERVRPDLPQLRHVMIVEDGTDAAVDGVPYEDALAAQSPERDFSDRSSDDIYAACTGGTTGMPKGVMWRHEDIFFASMGGGDPLRFQGPITAPEQLTERIPDFALVGMLTPPLMHVSAHWGAFNSIFGGGAVVFPPPGSFDPATVARMIGEERCSLLLVVGNAMATPFIEEVAANGHDVSSLMVIASGGAILSSSVKKRINEVLPAVMVMDGYGSTETGVAGQQAGSADSDDQAATFTVDENTTVLDDDFQPVAPGSGVVGRLARRGHIPLGYYKQSEGGTTFVERDGVRWVIPGDMATVTKDGMIVLAGRSSLCINTGGEKVFPEEVEAALIAHPDVDDVLVVGVPDDQWGSIVAAVVAPRPGTAPTLDELKDHARSHLAGYKLPRKLSLVDRVQRGPNGKGDYAWAKEQALSGGS